MLHKLGLINTKSILVVCRDGSRDKLSPLIYTQLIHAYYQGGIADYSCKEHKIKLANGSYLDINDHLNSDIVSIVEAVSHGWVFNEKSKYWVKDSVKFKLMHYHPILDVFEYGEYSGVGVGGRVVVDVGAFVGDSSIYFTLRGAKKVIAIEPHPGAFEEMLENIKLNNLEDKIIPINAGLASRPGKMCLQEVSTSSTWSTYYGLGDCERSVPAITLGEIISKYVSEGGDLVLKMDCEGCEYDVIMNDYENVSKFKEIIFEYHERQLGIPIRKVLGMLSKDFNCNILIERPRDFVVKCVRRT
jgi:FkbM family methyltransferase